MLKDSKAFSSISVDDLEKAKEFYSKTLGLKVVERKEMPLLFIEFAGGGSLMIYEKEDHKPAVFTVLNFPVKDVEKTVDDLIAKGITFEQYKDFHTDEKGISRDWDMEIAWLKDPAGNIIAILPIPKK
jgi:catechol 2,3-dioxygenase-like lactoylglutathione lyase family enzyme